MFVIRKCTINNIEKHAVINNNKLSFSWQMESDKNNAFQEAYEIEICNEYNKVIWNSGRINSGNSINVKYEGIALKGREQYFFKIKVWNNYGELAESQFKSFEIGLSKEDWLAKWIEADKHTVSVKEDFNMGKVFSYHSNPAEIREIPLDSPIEFSKEFKIKNKKVKKARIYVTAHGIYEAVLNNKKIGDEYLAPGFTTYPKMQCYQTHNITSQIKSGENEIKITVADGWYKGKIGLAGIGHQFGDKVALLSQIEVEYSDGELEVIATDSSFKASTSEVEYSDLFIGERQNHNLDNKKYYKVVEKNYGYDQLQADIAEPIKCIEKIDAKKIIITPKGETVVDFGRNIAGIVEVKIKGEKGEIIQLQHAEELDKEGNFFFNIMGQNKYQTTTYKLSGEEEEVFIPKFTYQGFRYVKVTENKTAVSKENFTAYVLSSDLKRTGYITISNEKVNKLLENIYHSQESNFISVPTDCPQREKGGWTGDAQIYTPTAIFNMKIDNFMKRWLQNMRLDQYKNGQVPGLIPWIESDNMLSGTFGNISAAGWSDACIIIPYHLYKQYEDIDFLKDNYEMMKKWVTYVEERCKLNVDSNSKSHEKYLWDMEFHYGDWLTPSIVNEDGSPNPMLSAKLTANQVATMYFAYSTQLLAEISSILGNNEESKYYKDLSSNIKLAFNEVYVNDDGIIEGDLQGLYTLAAYFKMADEETNNKFVKRLMKMIDENNGCLDTGFLATPILLDTLCQYGYREAAYDLLLQEKCPSWLYQVNQGATSIWESWQAILEDGTRTITSYNHYSLGSVQDFIVREIAGLKKSVTEKATYIIEPDFNSPFEYCNLSYETPYGEIKIQWNKEMENRKVKLHVPMGVKVRSNLLDKISRELGSGEYNL